MAKKSKTADEGEICSPGSLCITIIHVEENCLPLCMQQPQALTSNEPWINLAERTVDTVHRKDLWQFLEYLKCPLLSQRGHPAA